MLTDDLLELQRIDTTVDQLAHRRRQLPERTAAIAADRRRQANRDRRTEAASRDEELEVSIGALERDGDALTVQRSRLEAQLRTVAVPREAEALMHELETIAHRRDELDDQELACLEEQSQLTDEVARLDAELPELEASSAAAAAALAAVEASITQELATLVAGRAELIVRIDGPMLQRYERLRERLGGVAVARLEGARCGGCHLDLSTSELGDIKAVGSGQLSECPQCGRMLVP